MRWVMALFVLSAFCFYAQSCHAQKVSALPNYAGTFRADSDYIMTVKVDTVRSGVSKTYYKTTLGNLFNMLDSKSIINWRANKITFTPSGNLVYGGSGSVLFNFSGTNGLALNTGTVVPTYILQVNALSFGDKGIYNNGNGYSVYKQGIQGGSGSDFYLVSSYNVSGQMELCGSTIGSSGFQMNCSNNNIRIGRRISLATLPPSDTRLTAQSPDTLTTGYIFKANGEYVLNHEYFSVRNDGQIKAKGIISSYVANSFTATSTYTVQPLTFELVNTNTVACTCTVTIDLSSVDPADGQEFSFLSTGDISLFTFTGANFWDNDSASPYSGLVTGGSGTGNSGGTFTYQYISALSAWVRKE